jgi:hypothetical protein
MSVHEFCTQAASPVHSRTPAPARSGQETLGQGLVFAELVLRGGLRATVAMQGPQPGLAALAYVAVYLVEPAIIRRLKLSGKLISSLYGAAAPPG